MTSGGRRVRSGPPPDPNSRRRERSVDRSGFVHLPAAGRQGDAPDWPFSRPTKFEAETWQKLWSRPEAVEWERLGMEVQVAIYVRTLRAASAPQARSADRTALMRLQNDLGLSVAGRAANHWLIDQAPASNDVARRAPTSSAKDRLTVLKGGSHEAVG